MMSGVASTSAFAAEVRKISVTSHLEKKWGIFEILNNLENEDIAFFCQFTLTRCRAKLLMQRILCSIIHIEQPRPLPNLAKWWWSQGDSNP
ncbi:MAG: hypothetical protein LBB25_03760 [Holosporaceae bacterium]|nr:hypothetical protein [Holosporaceae bacterium]